MTRIMLENVRLSFAQALFVPEQFNGTGPFAWTSQFLLDPKNAKHAAKIAEIEADMKATFKAKCGNNFEAKWEALDWDDICLRDGKKKPDYEGYAGMKYVAARATQGKQAQPLVLSRNRTKITEAGQEGAPYSGCYVNAQVEIWAQYGTYKRVNATLLGVQFVRDGDAFGGGAPADPDAFSDLGDQGDEEGDLNELA
jgi:Protein of unknown function (DUF2815).